MPTAGANANTTATAVVFDPENPVVKAAQSYVNDKDELDNKKKVLDANLAEALRILGIPLDAAEQLAAGNSELIRVNGLLTEKAQECETLTEQLAQITRQLGEATEQIGHLETDLVEARKKKGKKHRNEDAEGEETKEKGILDIILRRGNKSEEEED